MASVRVGTGTSATYASMVDWGTSMVAPWVRDHLLYASNMQLSGMLDTGLIYYLLSVAWFPGFCLVMFSRPSARQYFVSRPSTRPAMKNDV
jgi:hypothetical protein